jgi:uncharacterized membrane protein
MTRNIVAYVVTIVVMVALDFVWLTQVGPLLYNPILHPIMLANPRMSAAIAFYVLYVLGVTYFATLPGIAAGQWQTAALKGALFGFFAYGTYDLTNHATLIIWSSKITLADMAWGTVLSAIGASVGCAVAGKIGNARAA